VTRFSRPSEGRHDVMGCIAVYPCLAAHRPFCVLLATPDGVDSRGGEYCVRSRDLCMKHQTFFYPDLFDW
jgi:hypothetical protein